MSVPGPAPLYKTGVVKQVLSGDTIVIRKEPVRGPPPEKIIALSGITAPKLARQRTPNSDLETKDEPYAWDAREYLRTKLIGKAVIFTSEKPPNSPREYGTVWAGKDPATDENLTESLLSLGYVKVREGARNIPQLKRLVDLEDAAKAQGKGVWGTDLLSHIRDVKWSVDNPKHFVNSKNMKPVKAVIEYVRDGSTIRMCLIPEFYQITLILSGIRCPAVRQDGTSEPYAEEARYFLESKLLHRDVEVILESANNNNFVGTILHPQGNIAEALLLQGFAKCVDWSLALMQSGATNLRAAEKIAKEAKRRIWVNYQSNAPVIPAKDKEFQAIVMEIVNGDAVIVKLPNNTTKKIFLASIRSPREKNNGPDEEVKQSPRPKGSRSLYDIPWLYEAREFLRQKMIGRKVTVVVDYIQPAKDTFPEKFCCTVLMGSTNIAEGLISKGLATVVRYRNDNDQRSCHYDMLLEAELKAQKLSLGLHAKKGIPTHRVQDTSGDAAKAKKFFPFLKRTQKTEAIVEFVASGSRMKLYINKESVLVTFLLAGINCPRGARPAVGGGPKQNAEPFGEEALQFTRDKCIQRDVLITIEEMDKAGNFIGWMWIDNENLSVSLIEHGFASVHHAAETSEYARTLKAAEEAAKTQRKGIWKNFVEVEKEPVVKENSTVQDRSVKYERVVITEITNEGNFYAQTVDSGAKLESLMEKIRQEFKTNAPLPGSYMPKRGNICAARFSADDQWYRAKVEKIQDQQVSVYYIDYGNREVLNYSRLAALPAGFESDPPYATEYILACVKFPTDPEDRIEAVRSLSLDTMNNKKLLLNIEVRGSPAAVTIVDPANNQDLGKGLIKEGLVLMLATRDRRLAGLVADYRAAQEHAKSSRLNLWRHGDITEDDAVEFGARR